MDKSIDEKKKLIYGETFLKTVFDMTQIKSYFIDHSKIRYVLRAAFAGAIVSFGYVSYILIDGNFGEMLLADGSSLHNLGHFLTGWIFGLCLVFIYYAKTELLTSNMMILSVSKYFGKISYKKMFKILIYCYIGNLLGGLFVGLLLSQSTIVTGNEAAFNYMNEVLLIKQGYVQAGASGYIDLLIRAIFCNFFINLSMMMVYGGYVKADGAKIIVMMTGVFFFMYLGLEHSVANTVFFTMAAFIPNSAFELVPAILNVLVVLIGNFIGGGVLIGIYYAFLNDSKRILK